MESGFVRCVVCLEGRARLGLFPSFEPLFSRFSFGGGWDGTLWERGEDFESVSTEVVPVSAFDVVYTDEDLEERIARHLHSLEEHHVPFKLCSRECALLRPEFQPPSLSKPIDVFEYRTRILASLGLIVLSPDLTALEIARFVNAEAGGEQVVHRHETDLLVMGV